jgi:serine protease Do
MSFFDKLRRQKFLSFAMILFTLSVGVVIGTLINTGVRAAKDNAAAPGATPLTIPKAVALPTNEFVQIAKQVESAVVNIATTYNPKPTPQVRRRARPTPQDDEEAGPDQGSMEEFFRRFFGGPFGEGMPQMPQRRGFALGSGLVVDPAGYLLTNNHVVDKADRIQVKFTGDPTQYDAKVVGVDVATDLAVLRVEGKRGLTAARIGNSDAVQVGDWAIAIGSPFGLQATVTAGIVSAKQRDIPGETGQFQHFLQTDAAINPGNSGGPLLNIRGEVIGINTAIFTNTETRGYQGVGFALPINAAVRVYNEIIKSGKVTRGGIGVSFTPSDTDTARNLLKAYGVNEGAFVQKVAPGGPAEKAGIRAEDVIVAINGKSIKNGNELTDTITATPVGTTVNITAVREGKRQDFKVTIGDLAQIFPEQFGGRRGAGPSASEGTRVKFGLEIRNLNDALRQNLGLKEAGGVIIDQVLTGSFSEDIGLQAKDVLLAINRQAVNSVDDVKRIQDTLKPGDAVAFRLLRSTGQRGEWAPQVVAGTLPNTP